MGDLYYDQETDDYIGLGTGLHGLAALGAKKPAKPKVGKVVTFCRVASQAKKERQAQQLCSSGGKILQVLACAPFRYTCRTPGVSVKVPPVAPPPPPAAPPGMMPAPAAPPVQPPTYYAPPAPGLAPAPVYTPPTPIPGGAPPAFTTPVSGVAPAGVFWDTVEGGYLDERGDTGQEIAQGPATPPPLAEAQQMIEMTACSDGANGIDEWGSFTALELVCPAGAAPGGGGGIPGVSSVENAELMEQGVFSGMGFLSRFLG